MAAGLPADLVWRRGPSVEPLATLDPALKRVDLDSDEVEDLYNFLANGLLDPRSRSLCGQIPAFVPSGARLHDFQGCSQ
jgi:hypothetical protein